MTRTLLRLARTDASIDFELRRFDGARSAFIRRLGLAELDWQPYRDVYEREMDRYCAEWRERNRINRRKAS